MPIQKTSAIPLYFTNVSNTSRVVTWMTARYGKLSTIIKGEQRKNSLFRGQYDLFSTSELVFYDRTEKGMHIAKECSMLTRRAAFRTDWRACASAGYISALLAKTTLRHGHEPERFEFFEEMLTLAETYGRHPAFLVWFDLQFADFQGQAIQLEDRGQKTEDRGQRTEDGSQRSETRDQRSEALTSHIPPSTSHTPAARFSAEHGGVIDPGYARQHRIPASPIAPEAVALLRAWQQADSPKEVVAAPCNPAYLAQIERVLEKFVSWQFDLPPHVRKKALETLRAA